MLRALKKRRLGSNELYSRPTAIEAMLLELSLLDSDAFIKRLKIQQRNNVQYVPSECILYFLRECKTGHGIARFEEIYRVLSERVLRLLPRTTSKAGGAETLTSTSIREAAFDRFVEMISLDRKEYCDKLDYFEVRFDGAVAKLRLDAQRQAWRNENRSTSLHYNDETSEISHEVELAAGSFDHFSTMDFEDLVYRSCLNEAIESLPQLQIRIIEMLRKGIPIASIDKDVITISKSLSKSEKTIRTHRDKAIKALKLKIKEGEYGQ